MPALLGSIALAPMRMLGRFLVNVIPALGIGLISEGAIYSQMQNLESYVNSLVGGLPDYVLTAFCAFGINQAISIIFGALIGRLTVSATRHLAFRAAKT